MKKENELPDILKGKKSMSPYPMHKLRKVEKPTTVITDKIERVDFRTQGFTLAFTGQLGPTAQKEILRFGFKHPLSNGIWVAKPQLMQLCDGEVNKEKAPIPEDPAILSNHIKSVGYFLRADIVGICKLPKWAVYSHDITGTPVECNHKYAIVIVVDQDYDTMKGSRGDDWISISESFLGYSHSALSAIQMAAYIRKLGYPAHAHFEIGPQGGYQVVLPPLLILSGIGEICRAGIALNPFLGTRFKASVVTTDLPLEPGKPVDFGLQRFCQDCKKCAEECPSKAISFDDKVMYNGYETWRFDFKRCTKYRVTNQNGASCGRCIKVCPWNKPEGWTHDLVRWMIQHAPLMNKLWVKMDDLMGYNKQDMNYKWWFDVEEVDGKYRIPKKTQTIID